MKQNDENASRCLSSKKQFEIATNDQNQTYPKKVQDTSLVQRKSKIK